MDQELEVTVAFGSDVDRDAVMQAIHQALADHAAVSRVVEEPSGRSMTGGEIVLAFGISIAAGLTIEGLKVAIRAALSNEQREKLNRIECEDSNE